MDKYEQWKETERALRLAIMVLSVNTPEGKVELWVANKWYAYASTADLNGKELWENKRPSRKTMLRLYRYIKDNYDFEEFSLPELFEEQS